MKNKLLILLTINILCFSVNMKSQNALLIKDFSDENYLQLSVSLPQPHISQRSYDDGITYDNIRVSGCNQYVAGGPDVPAFTTRILVPNGKTPSLSFSSGNSFLRENLILAPVQNPIPNVENPVIEFVKNLAIYNNDVDFPGVFAEITPVYHLRGQAYVYLKVFPYQYNPVQKTLSEYHDLTVTINFSGQIEPVPEKLQSSTYENMLKSVALNGNEVIQSEKNAEQRAPLDACTDCYDYLIVTHDDFLTAANTLAVWKNSIGIKTKVVPLSVSGNSNTLIKNYIKNEYLNYGIKYLLLLGDAEFIPTWYMNIHPYTEEPTTPQGKTAADIYYVDLDDDYNLLGFLPEADVSFGRIPVNNIAEANRIVQRIIKHEKEPLSLDFYKKASMISYFQNTDPHACSDDPIYNAEFSGRCVDERRFVRTCEEVRDFFLTNNIYDDIQREYTAATSALYPKYWSNEDWSCYIC